VKASKPLRLTGMRGCVGTTTSRCKGTVLREKARACSPRACCMLSGTGSDHDEQLLGRFMSRSGGAYHAQGSGALSYWVSQQCKEQSWIPRRRGYSTNRPLRRIRLRRVSLPS
jgi:hypothetical protein